MLKILTEQNNKRLKGAASEGVDMDWSVADIRIRVDCGYVDTSDHHLMMFDDKPINSTTNDTVFNTCTTVTCFQGLHLPSSSAAELTHNVWRQTV